MLLQRILQFNSDRDLLLVKRKYERMSADPFTFFRGTCHLFYADLAKSGLLREAPAVWICGDLHLENFGSYKGDNRLVYFDINDFDEAILAPCTFDIVRLLTSIELAFAQTEGIDPQLLAETALEAYVEALSDGKARWVERDTATGLVKLLLKREKELDRQSFLDERTEIEAGERRIKIRDKKTRPLPQDRKQLIQTFLESHAAQQPNPDFFKFIDAAWRIAGTGSLGLERYMVLVEGKGSPDENYLLDLKIARPSSLENIIQLKQPKWKSQGKRIVAIQKRMQAISPALLHAVTITDRSFVMREYQPTEDKIDLEENRDLEDLIGLVNTVGQVVAWAQLRSNGRQGAAIADDLIEFAEKKHWRKTVLSYAQQYSQKVKQYWATFKDQVKFE
uniref:DUF2252 domain-containing protein n=1 Tax=Cyanothece sp. (strain PCC 7425 / ATCC 29141) TaxID=395961 RepID=B8HPY2_CYAP4